MGGRNVTLGMWMVAAVALATMNGCESTPQQKDAENSALKEEVRTLRQENIDLKQQVFQANHKVAIEADAKALLGREMEKLRADLPPLKAAGAATTAAPVATAPVVTAPVVTAPVVTDAPKSADTEDKQARIKLLMTDKSDLERRATEIQITISTGETKIASLARATIDRKQEVPSGGKIENGTVYRQIPCPNPYTYQDGHYTRSRCGCAFPERSHFVGIGPAVIPGDFRTALEKTKAINELRSPLVPMHVELRTLNEQLTKVTQELAKLRAAP